MLAWSLIAARFVWTVLNCVFGVDCPQLLSCGLTSIAFGVDWGPQGRLEGIDPSERRGGNLQGFNCSNRTPRPESGGDCVTCAAFARQRLASAVIAQLTRLHPLLSSRACSVRETDILGEQQPAQGVYICDHAGLLIDKFSHNIHTFMARSYGLCRGSCLYQI